MHHFQTHPSTTKLLVLVWTGLMAVKKVSLKKQQAKKALFFPILFKVLFVLLLVVLCDIL